MMVGDCSMPWPDLQRLAVAFEFEEGYRIGFMLFGDGENSPEFNVRLSAIRSRAVAAVGEPPAPGQMELL